MRNFNAINTACYCVDRHFFVGRQSQMLAFSSSTHTQRHTHARAHAHVQTHTHSNTFTKKITSDKALILRYTLPFNEVFKRKNLPNEEKYSITSSKKFLSFLFLVLWLSNFWIILLCFSAIKSIALNMNWTKRTSISMWMCKKESTLGLKPTQRTTGK